MVDQRSPASTAEGLGWLRTAWIQEARRRSSTYSVLTAVLLLYYTAVMVLELFEADLPLFEVLLSAGLALAAIAASAAVLLAGVRLPRWFGFGFVLVHAAVSVYYIGFSNERQNAVAAVQEFTVMAVYLAWFYGPRIARPVQLVILVVVALAMAFGPFGGDAVAGKAEPGLFGPTNILGAVLLTWLCLEIGFFVRHRMRLEGETDALTGALNRRGFVARASEELRRARRRGTALSIALLDLDGFKGVNDDAGHEAGDAVLKSLVAQWTSLSRDSDVVARLGGDEFVMLFPGTTAAEADQVLHRIRLIAVHPWSRGVAEAQDGDTVDVVLRRADAAMYRDKRGG